MTDIDDLRERLVRKLRHRRPMTDRRTVDVLMPVMRKALADAWDDGHEWGAHNEHEFRPGRKITNPWRDEPNKGGDQ